MRIFKYVLQLTDIQTVQIPANSAVISAGLDPQDNLCIWVFVDPDALPWNHEVHVVGTGNPCPDLGKPIEFVETVRQGAFMWHVFFNTIGVPA